MELNVIFLSIILQISFVKCDDVVKSSLTFVIDDTGSMSDDIEQVKAGVNLIFDAVVDTKYSQIENFVLVTFNDPDIGSPTITRDRDTFKRALDEIVVYGGGDCPEYSMSGIERALEESLPGSYIYVFTDAAAKDYKKYKQVKSLAQKKSSQIVFLLTGLCDGNDEAPNYLVYYDLADAAGGQVFHLEKTDVGEILDYVIESIKGRTTVLASDKFPPGYGHKIKYTTDEHVPSVLISVSGEDPKVKVTDAEGGKPDTKTVVDLKKVAVIKVTGAKPGEYTAEVGSKSKTSAVITGTTTIDFQYGFSPFKPTSIKDTASKPQPGVSCYLTVKLNIVEGEEVNLTRIQILDIDGKAILEGLVEILDEKERLYVTSVPIMAPNKMFRIMVIGNTVISNATITRMTPTPIEPQDPSLEKTENRPPKVTIVGAPKIIVNFEEATKISCRVHGYPKPDIIWQEQSSTKVLTSMVAAIELPYEYISILEINKRSSNGTYLCKANNAYGIASQTVDVILPIYLNVLESPEDAVVKYDTSKSFVCKVDASPPAKIIWSKNGNKLGKNDDVSISPDGSVLIIPKMEPHLRGSYECEADNGYKRETLKFKVAISGVEPPKIDKHVNKVHVAKGSDPELICSVTEGIPPPKIIWHYKSYNGKRFSRLRKIHTDRIKFKNITSLKAGVYKCTAYNAMGHDVHDMELVVEYPPKIKESLDRVSGKAGETLTLKCEVDAIPTAIVVWTKNDVLIKNTPSTQIFRDHTLKLQLSVEDSGTYQCFARNLLGTTSMTINVDVYVPAQIAPPKESPVLLKVGEDLSLECDADGIPKPEVKWMIRNKFGDASTKSIAAGESTNLYLPRAQLSDEGYYICIASNSGGSYNITYDVRIYAPPDIENVYLDKTFRPVEGDLVLIIKCNATGNPKPEITWTKNGMNIASGTPKYDIDEDGTLLIKNVDAESAGTYVCRADNVLGRDTELFYVAVDPYPHDASPTSIVLIEKGSSNMVECNVPHNIVDSIRWYKDGKLLLHGELSIDNAQMSDSGLYICRVSDFFRSRSGYTKIQVGYKPSFTTVEELNVELIEEYIAELICAADAEPPAKTTWWHNGKITNVTTQENIFYMDMSHHGNFTCEVKNEFGKIQRTFLLRSKNCILDVKEDFNGNQPIMFTSPLNWPTNFEIVDGQLIIPNGQYVSLSCAESFKVFTSPYAMAFCEGERNFTVKGISYNYSELKCTTGIEPNIYPTGDECLGEGSELLRIEYEVLDGFLRAYDVCFDQINKLPFYAKHDLDRHEADVEPKNINWLSSDLLPLDFDKMYDCNRQIYNISVLLGKWFHVSDRCCFSKRQLINSRDMLPGVLQSSTFNYLNVVPHWSTCNTNNWDDLEQRLRNLVKSIDYPLTVWTGTFKHLELPSSASGIQSIYLNDDKGGSQPVPRYLWKVVQDPVSRSSLAIVQINIPDLNPSEAFEYVLCGDICDDVHWLKGSPWHDTSKGYTYCCNIEDFENAFGLKGVFKRGYHRVLKNVAFLTSHSLT